MECMSTKCIMEKKDGIKDGIENKRCNTKIKKLGYKIKKGI